MIVFWILALFFFGVSFFLFLFQLFGKRRNELILETEIQKHPNIAILIPARDESQVIEGLLTSILKQTVEIPPENVFVIVEEETDKTIEIVKSKKMNFFVRKKLHLKTKGYALAEMVEELENQKRYYDCYFIFDADNILAPDFMERMLEDYHAGYAVSTGYRALKNSDQLFPFCAGLTFYMINELKNKNSLKYHGNLILSGTGYYIHGRLIKEWKTFPFHSLTEDYESSLYYTLHGVSTHYQEDAVFFDEQPENYKKSIIQRSRWIKGYFHNWLFYRKKFQKKLRKHPKNIGSVIDQMIGILPLLSFLASVCLLFLSMMLDFHIQYLWFILIGIGCIYCFLLLLTAFLVVLVTKRMNVKKSILFFSLFYHPIFLLSYIHAFLKSLSKNTGWDKISHGSDSF